MEITRIKFTADMAYGKLPSWVAEVLDKEKSVTFVALDDYNSILGLAIFTLSPTSNKELVLRYIFVEDEVRKIGIATDILKYASEELKKMGVYAVISRIFGDDDEQYRLYRLLTAAEYVPVNMGGHFMNYSLKEIKESILAAQKSKLAPALKKVKFLNEISMHERKAFLVKSNEHNLLFDLESVDLLFSRFYVEDGQIVGYMNLKEVSENVIFLSDIYIEESVNAPLAITTMLASMINISCSVMPDETKFYFQVYEDNEFNGFQTAFGKKDEDITISEYVKIL